MDSFSRRDSTVAVFFDLEKAYDTTWRYGILRSLHEAGIRGPLAWFIKNFLSERKFKTRIGNEYSDYFVQEQGVPQGSVLSCSLFIVAINRILQSLPQYVKGMLYVDDLVIYSSSQHIPSIERRLQSAINKIETWVNKNGFRFSTQKTVAVHFHRKRGLQQEPSLNLYNRPIVFKTSMRYLGLILDQRMRWNEHISYIKTTALKSLDLLKSLSRTKYGGDRITLLRLYRSLIRSKLDYGCFIYWTASDHILKKLDPVHNAGIRLCTGAFKSSPIESLYAESGEQSLYYRRTQLALQYYLRCRQSMNHNVIEPIPREIDTPDRRLDTKTFCDRIHIFLQTTASFPNLHITETTNMNDKVWLIPEIICSGFDPPNKGRTPPAIMKTMFREHVNHYHSNTLQIFTDGSKTENGVGYGVHTVNQNYGEKLNGHSSVFTAELSALLKAVKLVSETDAASSVIFSDSQSAIMSLQAFNSSHPIICEILAHIIPITLNQNRTIQFCWVPSHVGVDGNEEADRVARQKADCNDEIPNYRTYYKDFFPTVRVAIFQLWQEKWLNIEGNKLRKIKDNVRPWKACSYRSRRVESVLCRLRIGHTLFSHGHHMERRPPPYCEDCIVPLTVKHILAECPSYQDQRNRLFPHTRNINDSTMILKQIIGENNFSPNINALMQYLQQLNIINSV